MKILLQPASSKEASKHFEDTIENGVTMSLLKSKLPIAEFNKLSKLNDDRIKVWGIVPQLDNSSREEWDRLKEGDWVVFYKNKKFFYVAEVFSKIHNKKLAEELWGKDGQGRLWEYIYFIKEGKSTEIPYSPQILKKQNGEPYKKNHIIQGAFLLEGSNKDAMRDYIEGLEGGVIDEEKIEPTEKEENIVKEISKKVTNFKEVREELKILEERLKNKEPKEKIRIAKSISRNSKLARLIKENAKYICQICGEKPFLQKNGIAYAEAHHIQELSKSGLDVPSNVVCVCPTCHEVIHHGCKDALEKRKNLKIYERKN